MKIESTRKRRVYLHSQLASAARSFAKEAEATGSFNSAMASALFCALSLEATLNFIGSAVLPAWGDYFERKLSPEGKLVLLASQFQFEVQFGEGPFQTFRDLFELRNELSHGKTRDCVYEKSKHWLNYENSRRPAAQWETLCTAEQVQKLVADTETMIAVLHNISGVERVPPFLLAEHF
jgi:hypothetical protein